MNPILTIAIPTYNRPRQIKTQVEILVPQLCDEVRLLVLDNYSETPVTSLFDDGTLSRFDIVRNQFNIGPDANIAKCVDLCTTEWLLILGDDDPMTDDAVATMLADLRSAPEGTVFLNYDPKTECLVRGLDGLLCQPPMRYWCLFWMSGCVYNLKLLHPSMRHYFGSISTMQPGIVLLVNHLAEHPEHGIWVTGHGIHREAGPDIGWSRDAFVYASLFVFDVLQPYKKRLDNTLFSTIAGLLYRHVITISKKEKNRRHSLRLIHDISARRGCWNTLCYDFHWYVRSIWHGLILQQ